MRAQHLTAALGETRSVLELARSPMLLTMITYLFLEGVFGEQAEMLPRSRAGFYELAIRYLLGRDTARGLETMTARQRRSRSPKPRRCNCERSRGIT
ncbi:hypothetical protein [Nonomuraea sp. NPDC003754]